MIEWNRRAGIGVMFAVVTLTTALACRSKEPKLSVAFPAQSSHFARGDTIHFAPD